METQEFIISLFSSGTIIAIVSVIVTRLFNKKSDDLDVAEKQRNEYKSYIKTLEAKIERLANEVRNATESAKADKLQVEKLTEEVGRLKDKISELIDQREEDRKTVARWEEEDKRKEIVIEEKIQVISEQQERIKELEKNE